MYSRMLYIMSRTSPQIRPGAPVAPFGGTVGGASAGAGRTRVTFRVGSDVADALRQLPNQTAFVERTLREALGHVCPLCRGSGDAPGVHLSVSDLKRLARLDRSAAAQLKALVRLGRQLLATQLELNAPADDASGLLFRLAREDQLLLSGIIPSGQSEVALKH